MNGRRTVVGVMGGSVADARTAENARGIGRLIAENGWVLLSGGFSSVAFSSPPLFAARWNSKQ